MQFIADFMVALSHWIQTATPLPTFALWLQKQWYSDGIAKTPYLIPLLQTIHTLAVAMLITAVLMITLRVFMVAGKNRTLGQTLHRFVPWIWWCLLVCFITGWLLAIGEPPRDMTNPAFWTKMVFVPCAALIALGIQSTMSRNLITWEAAAAHRGIIAQVAAILFILLWLVIMALGRWIAYVPT